MKLAVSLVAVAIVALVFAAPPQAKVSPSLIQKLEGGERATVILTVNSPSTRDLLSSQTFQERRRTFTDRAARLNGVASFLKERQGESQRNLVAFLQREKSAETIVTPLWVSNQIILRNADLTLVQKLSKRPDVAIVREEKLIPLHPVGEAKLVEGRAEVNEVQWGVEKILAQDVWASGNTGEGIVVSNIDTGVRGGHEALVDNHRPAYGWYDPAGKTASPNDYGGHGTHTMGSIAGGGPRGIGVAPGAQWVACKGCGLSNCAESDLLECGQWVACPTDHLGGNANCPQAPHLVSNSWGGGQGDPFYDGPIATWREAGIIPLFSIGNSGPTCGTANSPGDSPDVIGVGSTNKADGVSSFSSLGPAVNGLRKPDIAAPGTDIVSASNLANNRYATMSGTSMSCPHAAGLTALLLSQFGPLEYDQVRSILESGTVPHKPTAVINCGSLPNNKWPNNHVGHGRINAVNTVLVNQTLSW